jgi:hypothetical protein
MREESDQKYIHDLVRHTKDSIRFFSNDMKKVRERSVCAALLRCLGVEFTPDEIQPNNDDPPDIFFKSACFEVIELYDKRRKRLDEYKERLKELEKAKSIEDSLVPFHKSEPISYRELEDEILVTLNKKASKYGKRLCSALDALVYVGLPGRFLDVKPPIPKNDELSIQGWRSLSFIIPPYSHIVFCRNNAPKFLAAYAGHTKAEWKEPDGFFDLE